MSSNGSGAVLITGATGFVGMELLARYLERSEHSVIALVRAKSDGAARLRLDGVLANLFGSRGAAYADRVEAVAGELTAPRLGLSAGRWRELASRVSTIVHSAASVSFTMPLGEARAINLEGTRQMLELAGACAALACYGHVSTAYVAGTHAGRFCECDLELGQGFRNSYEQSKYEAEQLVRAAGGVPFTIMRPSIVVGDRHSGWTSAFNVLYWPLRALSRGLFPAVPATASGQVDVVSIDYVADGVYELCEGAAPGDAAGGVGATYHLTAGAQASTIEEIARLASGYFRQPKPEVLSPAQFDERQREGRGMRRSTLEGSVAYFPYFSVDTVFDDAATRARLEPAGISASPLDEYLERLLDFATRSRWGKRPIGRAEALAA